MAVLYVFLLIISIVVGIMLWVDDVNTIITKVCTVVFAGCTIVSIIVTSNYDATHIITVREKSKLVCLNDNQFIEGHMSMFLGGGRGDIKQEFKYSMYVKTTYGAKMVDIPAKQCNVVYSNWKVLEKVYKTNPEPTDWRELFYFITEITEEDVTYNIYVPENTINNKFQLDAQ